MLGMWVEFSGPIAAWEIPLPTTTQLWQSPKFAIERTEDEEHGALIFRIRGVFAANEMYGVLKPFTVVNIFDFDPAPGKELPGVNVFDITEVPTLDSSGLGLIISHFIRCRARGVRVVAVGISPNVMQLFKFTRTDSLIPTAASVEEALAAPRA